MIFDLAVAGAGPAGSCTAAFAAREGLRVVLLDRCRFPRDKACGDGVTSPALNVLERLGLLEIIESGGFHQGHGFILTSPRGESFRCDSPVVDGLRPYGYNVPRKVLDHMLVQRAQELGARLMEGFRAVEMIPSAGQAGLIRSADGREVRARLIVRADGGLSMIRSDEGGCLSRRAERNSVPMMRHERNWCAAVRAYFDGVEGLRPGYPEITFFPFSAAGYAWIFPLGPERANVGIGSLLHASVPGMRSL
ncbi:MAG: NAD(P)/FAD-dependent oxidoreductase, partial [Deltaproteobacteria bacterium]|nr:NAD(P)/FAD-dependent oxidoreductase [Deltaproteobacteria bacterium]